MLDPVDFVRSTMQPMAEHSFPYITSIVGVVNESEGEFVGSGFRCLLRGRHCIVTAAHVVDQASTAPLGAAFTAIRGQPPHRLPPAPRLLDCSTDLAICFLSEQIQIAEDIQFWPQERIDVRTDVRSRDYLFVHGFPGERSRFLFGGLRMRSLPYGVMERDDDLPGDMKSFEFAMDYDPGNMLPEHDQGADFVAPPGLSGSPVFRIGVTGRQPEEWLPEHSMLVGVVTRWNHDKRVLLATGANSLLELLDTIVQTNP